MLYLSEKNFRECKELNSVAVGNILSFIKNNDLKSIACGRYDISEGLFVNIFESQTKEDDGVFEEHREYVDIHYLIDGVENIKYKTCEKCKELSDYDKNGDYQLFEVDTNESVSLEEGDMAIFFTREKHKPCLTCKNSCTIKKAVFKLRKQDIK